MRRPPRSKCGMCGKRNAELRTAWGAPICGSCSGEQELDNWLAQLASTPEVLLDDPFRPEPEIVPERVARPKRPPPRPDPDPDDDDLPEFAPGYGPLRPLRLPPFLGPPARPDRTVTWVDWDRPRPTWGSSWRLPHVR